jgi:hypothetical protein
VLDLLRLGHHQLLAMRVPQHAAVAAMVDLAAATVGERVTGVINAVLRRVAAVIMTAGWPGSRKASMTMIGLRCVRRIPAVDRRRVRRSASGR